MSRDESFTRCKQCGKIIVGNSKFGLCDSCFNGDVGKAGIAAGISAALYKVGRMLWDRFIHKK